MHFIYGLIIGAICGYAFRGYISHKIHQGAAAASQAVAQGASAIEKKL